MNTKFNFKHNDVEYFFLEGYWDSAISEDSLSGELVFTAIEIEGEVTAESFKAATIKAVEAANRKPLHGAPEREWVEFGNEPMEF